MLEAQGWRKLTELISVTKIVNGNPEMWTQDWMIPLWLSGILLPASWGNHYSLAAENWYTTCEMKKRPSARAGAGDSAASVKWAQYTGQIHNQTKLYMLLYVHLHIFPVWLEIQVLAVQMWLHHTPVSWRLCEVAHSLETRHPGWKGPLITGRDLGNSEASPGSQRSRPCWETRNISIRKKTLQTMALSKHSQEGFGEVFSLFFIYFYLFIHLFYLFCAVPKPV